MLVDIDKRCSKCNKIYHIKAVYTTNSIRSGDLDLRPPPMTRDIMETWIQRCTYCGYSSPNVENENSITSDFLQSNKYHSILQNKKVPDLCISFLCWAVIANELQLYNESVAAYLDAAWVCDDKLNAISNESRLKCIDEIKKAQNNNQLVIQSPKSDDILMLDLLRRTVQ